MWRHVLEGIFYLNLVLIGIQTERDLVETLAWIMCFSGSGICLNVESIVCVLCVEDTLVQECKTERVGEGGCPSES